jgi:hypothetical protein
MAQEAGRATHVLIMTHIRVSLNNKFDIVDLKLAFVFEKNGRSNSAVASYPSASSVEFRQETAPLVELYPSLF